MQQSLVGSVEALLCPWQPPQPLLGPINCQTPQVYNDHLVRRLRLTITPRVKTGAYVQLGPGQLEKLSPKRAGEHRVPIADDGLRQTMEADNFERPCHRCRRVGMAQWDEVRYLQKTIDHCQDDRLVVVNAWKAFDEIHGQVAPNLLGNGSGCSRLEGCRWLVLLRWHTTQSRMNAWTNALSPGTRKSAWRR
jgi:hypothetical protein